MVGIKTDANQLVEDQLNNHLVKLSTILDADVFSYVGPIFFGLEVYIRNAIEDVRKGRKTKSKKVVFILETNGGFITVVQRIVDTLRKHYQRLEYIVPDSAMSAGTVLVLSGDAIHMDYFSVLGPIDPQIEKGNMNVSALGYLEKYNEFIKKDIKTRLSAAEMAYFVKRFDPATLSFIEHQRDLSITLLKEWLVKYKFRNWKKTKTKKQTVTHAMKVSRAEEIAKILNDTSVWHSHARGITMEVLKRKLKLHIEDFGKNTALLSELREYTNIFSDYNMKMGNRAVVHSYNKYRLL